MPELALSLVERSPALVRLLSYCVAVSVFVICMGLFFAVFERSEKTICMKTQTPLEFTSQRVDTLADAVSTASGIDYDDVPMGDISLPSSEMVGAIAHHNRWMTRRVADLIVARSRGDAASCEVWLERLEETAEGLLDLLKGTRSVLKAVATAERQGDPV